jgi:hypothetical protein
MTILHSAELSIFADYFQFYLQDEGVHEDWGAFWTDETLERMLAVGDCSIGIATMRNMSVPVAIAVHDDAPEADFHEWELVNECSFRVRTGRVMVLGCTEGTPQERARFSLPPGSYRVRVSYVGLDTLSDDALDGDDFYRLQIWPAPPAPTLTLKTRRATAG